MPDEPRYLKHLGCPCGECDGFPPDTAALQETAHWLEEVERALGGHQLLILGGYQCPEEQARHLELDGAAHTEGRAVDFVVRKLSPRSVQVMLRSVWPDLVQSLGSWRGFTHVARGGEHRLWRE